MVQAVAVDSKTHKNLAIDLNLTSNSVASQRSVPVVLDELQKVATQSPIVFTKNATTGQFVVIAMLGFDQGENLFCEANKWEGFYTPFNIMRQPFFVGDDKEAGDDDYLICVDVENPAVILDVDKSDRKSERIKRIFDKDSKDTDYFSNIKEMLMFLLQEEKRTQRFVDTLLDFDLIKPVPIGVTFNNQQPQRIDGLYSIDEDKLNVLPDADILKLCSDGFIKAIYTMISSLEQIPVLVDKKIGCK